MEAMFSGVSVSGEVLKARMLERNYGRVWELKILSKKLNLELLTLFSPQILTTRLWSFRHQYLRVHEQIQKNVASVILGGSVGIRLFPLTRKRTKPAVPIGGCYRLIDIPMSNCINSGINKIFVLTQFNSASLNRHLARTYYGNGINFGDGFVEVWNP